MLNLVLYQPQIPPNTGNLIRLCANTGIRLHLIGPLGFQWDDKKLLRAGLDYHEWAHVVHHRHLEAFLAHHAASNQGRLVAIETTGTTRYDHFAFAPYDYLILGAETFGLPQATLEALDPKAIVYIPQQPHSRSLNLSNAASIVAFEALRQLDFGNNGP